MKCRKVLALLLTMAMLAVLLGGCGGSSESVAFDNAAAEAPKAEAMEEAEVLYSGSTADSGTGSAAVSEQKLIKTVNIDAETEDLETMLAALQEQIGSMGGYVEGQEIYNGSSYSSYRYRSAHLTIRIPADKLEGFVSEVNGLSNVVNYNETTDDVTLTYVATESRITALETEQKRLLELLEKAETMADLLVIEERLTDVRYELENVTSQLRVLSNKVSYATVYLSIDQVKVYTEVEEPTVWERITGGFTRNLENIGEGLVDFFVWAVTYSPQLLFWALVIVAAVTVLKRTAKKRKAAKVTPADSDGDQKK